MSERLDWFKLHAKDGVKYGAVSCTLYLSYLRYLVYLDYREKGFNMEKAIFLTAREMDSSRSSLQRDIRFFQ